MSNAMPGALRASCACRSTGRPPSRSTALPLPARTQAGVPRDTAQCGAVTLIQRFGSALNLNVHFHMLWLDGVYDANVEPPRRKPRLRRARAPTSAQLTQLANTIAHRASWPHWSRHLARISPASTAYSPRMQTCVRS
jgi:hypothetical protein